MPPTAYWPASIDWPENQHAERWTRHERDLATALLLAITDGNPDMESTFLTLVRPWTERVRETIVRRVFGRTGVDEDAVHDASTDVQLRLFDANRAGEISAWDQWVFLYRRYLEQACRGLRRREKEKPNEIHLSPSVTGDLRTREEDLLERKELSERLEDLKRHLRSRENEIVHRTAIEGKPFQEVGKMVKLSSVRVRKIQKRAFARLRAYMERLAQDDPYWQEIQNEYLR